LSLSHCGGHGGGGGRGGGGDGGCHGLERQIPIIYLYVIYIIE